MRSSPTMAGPSFLRSTSIAAQLPARACPWSMIRAFIVSPPAAKPLRANGPMPTTSAPRSAARDAQRESVALVALDADAARGLLDGGLFGGGRADSERAGGRTQRRREPPRSCAARAIVRFPPVPSIRPFRALRYSREQVEDLSAVVAPPYDVIGPGGAPPAARPRPAQRRPPGPARGGPPATRPTSDIAARRGQLFDMADRRHAAPGSAAGAVPVRADLPRAGHGADGDAAGRVRTRRAGAIRAVVGDPGARADARRAARGPIPAASRHGREHEPRRRHRWRPAPVTSPAVAPRRRRDATGRRARRRGRRRASTLDGRGRGGTRPAMRRSRPPARASAPRRSRWPTGTIATRPRCAMRRSGARGRSSRRSRPGRRS